MTDHATTDPTDQDDRLQRRRKVLVALGAGTAAWALPSITTVGRSAAATGSTVTTPTTDPAQSTSTTGSTTTTTTAPTTTTTEAPTSTTTTAPSGLVLDHDLPTSYGTLPVWVSGSASAEVWQEIAPTFSGVLSRIVVQGGGVGSPLTVNVHRIRTEGAYPFPDGPSLGGATIPAPTTGDFVSRTFDLSVPVQAGTRYLLVFSAPVEGPSYGWNVSFGNAAPGLVAYVKGSGQYFPDGKGSLLLQTYLLPS